MWTQAWILVAGGRTLTTTSRPSAKRRPVTSDKWATSNSTLVGCAPSHRSHHATNASLWINRCTCHAFPSAARGISPKSVLPQYSDDPADAERWRQLLPEAGATQERTL